MSDLSVAHVNLIIREVSRHQITFSHLCDDLIDHICCDVEDEMQNGLPFEKAYSRVKEKIGIRGLNKIQEETLYAVDNKYRKMKNTMKITGIAGTVLLGFAALSKIMHWPLAGILLVTGAFLLVVFFMPSSMMVLWKESKSKKNLFLFVSAFLAGTLFIVGVMFKIQHWPGSGLIISLAILSGGLLFLPAMLMDKVRNEEDGRKKPLYYLGFLAAFFYLAFLWQKIMHWQYFGTLAYILSIALFLVVIPLYVYQEWKSEKSVDAKFIFLVIALVTILLPSSLISLNLQQNYNDGFFTLADKSQETMEFQKKVNKSLFTSFGDSVSYTEMVKVQESTSRVIQKMDEIKSRLVDLSGGTKEDSRTGGSINYGMLLNPFDPVSTHTLLSPGSETRSELDSLLTGYLNGMKSLTGSLIIDPGFRIMALLPGKPVGQDESTLITSLHALNLLETAILQVESDSYRCLARNHEKSE